MDAGFFTFKDDEWVVPELRDFFGVPATRQKIVEIAGRYGLDPGKTEKLFEAIRDIVRGRVGEDDITEAFVEHVGLEYEQALDIHGDLAAELFPAVDEFLEEQAGIYREMHPEDFLPPPPPDVDVTEDVARKLVETSGFAPADPVLRRRMESIILSRLKDVRDEAEARAMLEKPAKTGGMGFTPEQAAATMLLVTENLSKVAEARTEAQKQKEQHAQLLRQAGESKEQRIKALADRLKIVAPQAAAAPQPAAPQVTKADLGLDVVNDEKEAKKLEAELPKKIVAEEVTEAASAMDTMVNEALSAVAVTLPDEDMKRRFRTLVTLYFRDLRDALETKSKFTMPTTSGGMGMPEAEADRVMGILKERVKGFSTAAEGRAADSKAKFVSEQATKHMEGQAAGERKEQEALDRQYKGLLEKTGVAAPAGAQRLAPPAPPRIVPVTGPETGSSALPQVKPIPQTAPSVSVAAPAAPAASAAAVPQPPAPPVVPATAAPPTASPASMVAAPTTGAIRPTVADVKFVPKLIGPVDELRALTLKDFRKLSKEPREATLKVKDKIDLLEDQGFERKTEAIKAWQDSEVNKMYLDILRKSLEGKPVTEVIAERELAAQVTLNKAEFDAIMELNRKLRFG